MRIFKFRAFAKHTVNLAYQYANEMADNKYDPMEPDNKESSEWDAWYEAKQEAWDFFKDEYKGEEYDVSFEMITNFMVNDKLQTPYGYKIIEVMQYTGINDSAGVEVYEEDFIKYKDEYMDDFVVTRIKWFGDNEYPAFDLADNPYETNGLSHLMAACSEFYVIGNVYEDD